MKIDVIAEVDLNDVSSLDLLESLKERGFDVLGEYSDFHIMDEVITRGLDIPSDYHQDESSVRLEELEDNAYDLYRMAIDVVPNLEKIREYIERNFNY